MPKKPQKTPDQPQKPKKARAPSRPILETLSEDDKALLRQALIESGAETTATIEDALPKLSRTAVKDILKAVRSGKGPSSSADKVLVAAFHSRVKELLTTAKKAGASTDQLQALVSQELRSLPPALLDRISSDEKLLASLTKLATSTRKPLGDTTRSVATVNEASLMGRRRDEAPSPVETRPAASPKLSALDLEDLKNLGYTDEFIKATPVDKLVHILEEEIKAPPASAAPAAPATPVELPLENLSADDRVKRLRLLVNEKELRAKLQEPSKPEPKDLEAARRRLQALQMKYRLPAGETPAEVAQNMLDELTQYVGGMSGEGKAASALKLQGHLRATEALRARLAAAVESGELPESTVKSYAAVRDSAKASSEHIKDITLKHQQAESEREAAAQRRKEQRRLAMERRAERANAVLPKNAPEFLKKIITKGSLGAAASFILPLLATLGMSYIVEGRERAELERLRPKRSSDQVLEDLENQRYMASRMMAQKPSIDPRLLAMLELMNRPRNQARFEQYIGPSGLAAAQSRGMSLQDLLTGL